MSAVARYFRQKGLVVAGYDKTPSDLTRHLEQEGIQLHYEENTDLIPEACKNPVCNIGGLHASHSRYAQGTGFFPCKWISDRKASHRYWADSRKHTKDFALLVHTARRATSTMCAHIMHQSHFGLQRFPWWHFKELRH